MIKVLKEQLSQIYAIAENNIKLSLRYKINFILRLISPIISIIIPLIILGKFFEYNAEFGPWNKSNYMIYIFMAYNITLLRGLMGVFSVKFLTDKYWKTIALYMIAPFKRYSLVFGVVISYFILIFIPFLFFFLLCYIYFPVSFSTILFMIFLYFLLALVFSGMGILIGIFAISNENIMGLLGFFLNWFFWFSCLTYPFQLFPPFIQVFINLNPFYHMFSFLRLAWIENNALYSITWHFYQFLILFISALLLPVIGVFIFNKVFKKYGIIGY
ncbi:MAG: ABC transporter permease [Promethearchaeota archaeon]